MMFGGVSWEEFKTFQTTLGEGRGARVSYLDGIIQFMTVSLEHESRKSHLGRLLEAYLFEKDVEIFPHGNATLESKRKKAAKEPDESYCFHVQKKTPDLAIEVAITRGGIDTLELYRRWQIPEVWIWQSDRLRVFHFENGAYAPASRCLHFPNLDLALLEKCARIPSVTQARREFLAGLKKKRRR